MLAIGGDGGFGLFPCGEAKRSGAIRMPPIVAVDLRQVVDVRLIVRRNQHIGFVGQRVDLLGEFRLDLQNKKHAMRRAALRGGR